MGYTEFTVPLRISADEYKRLYSGSVNTVIARDRQGRRIQFPASALRRFVTHEGIAGVFIIRVDQDNKLLDIRRDG